MKYIWGLKEPSKETIIEFYIHREIGDQTTEDMFWETLFKHFGSDYKKYKDKALFIAIGEFVIITDKEEIIYLSENGNTKRYIDGKIEEEKNKRQF